MGAGGSPAHSPPWRPNDSGRTQILLGLEDTAIVKPWNNSFKPGVATLDALMANANEAGLRALRLRARRLDGIAVGRRRVTARQRGIRGGAVRRRPGWRRSMIVHAQGVKLPSDLLGLTVIPYDGKGDAEREGQLVSAKIKGVIADRGWRGSETLAGQMQGTLVAVDLERQDPDRAERHGPDRGPSRRPEHRAPGTGVDGAGRPLRAIL
jgi:hypothetical protein